MIVCTPNHKGRRSIRVDCDDAMLFLARGDAATLTGVESAQLANHVSDCARCGQLAARPQVLVAKVDADALDDPDSLALPTIDPSIFDIEGAVGQGGMGRVVRAFDRRLGRTVAIKEVVSERHRARLEREAQVTARLQHPAIVPVYEAGTWPDGSAFYTMRLVAGTSLAVAIAKRETLSERLALLPNVISVVDALAYAHSERVIHRDLKPQNILVGEFGETVVIDWGLAKELDREQRLARHESPAQDGLTRAGSVLGTPSFMAPEQARAEAADTSSDVYALGAILYTLLAGHPPYWDTDEGATSEELVELAVLRPPTPIDKLAQPAPADLIAIVERAMARRPTDRFADAGPMASELRRFEAGRLLESRPYSAGERIARWVRRHRALVSVTVAALLVIIIGSAFAVSNIVASRDSERGARLVAEEALTETEARRIELIFQQARAALETDPTVTIAWLKQYPENGPRAQAAGMLAAEARGRGVSWRVFESPSTDVWRLAFISAGRLVAGGGAPLRVWTLETGAASDVAAIKSHKFGFDPESNSLIGTSDGRIVRQHLATGELDHSHRPRTGRFSRAAFSARLRVAVLGLRTGELERWDLASGRVRRIKVAPWSLNTAAVVGDHAVVGDDRANLWRVPLAGDDTPTQLPLPLRATIGGFGSFASPNNPLATRFAVRSSSAVFIVSTKDGSVEQIETEAVSLALSANAQRLATGNEIGEVAIIDLASKQELRRLGTDGRATSTWSRLIATASASLWAPRAAASSSPSARIHAQRRARWAPRLHWGPQTVRRRPSVGDRQLGRHNSGVSPRDGDARARR